jgi:HAD superfamily hydrolase (TIGR01549 family)
MHVLIWTPPWPVHGDPRFFLNAFHKHLALQANALAGRAARVSVVAPAHFAPATENLDPRINLILLPQALSRVPDVAADRIYPLLYTDPAGDLAGLLQDRLAPYLPEQVDVVLLWENPAPFLRALYPDALIINQMPGTFSRPPYPHLITFDPVGLYRHGLLQQQATAIQQGAHLGQGALALADEWGDALRLAMGCFRNVADQVLAQAGTAQSLALLPLQSSKHYAFAPDSGFTAQLDMLWSVLDSLPPDCALVVTQYRNGVAADMPLDAAMVAALAANGARVIYDPALDQIDNASQYLLPHMDRVISASSSLGLQGMVWQNRLTPLGQTFLAPYGSDTGPVQLPWDQRCRHVLGTILTRHQPMAQLVTQDGDFLHDLLSEMAMRQRAGRRGLDLLPDLMAMVPDYGDRLVQGLRLDRAAKSLAMAPRPDATAGQMLKLRALVDDPATQAVSFDVFDTLLCRPVEKPADLYRFLEPQALALTGGVAADFGRIRALCETETRARLAGAQAEITLDDIYHSLAAYYGLDHAALAPLQQAEIAMELDFARPRPFGKRMFDLAVARGKSVVLVSDMYLPGHVVARMLAKAGYAGSYAALFVSADHGCTKADGGLFDLVLADLGIAPAALVHVGDNKQTDIAMAETRGIRALRWSAAIEWQRSNPAFKDIYPPRSGAGEKARSAIAGTTARGLFDAPVPPAALRGLGGGDPYRLGFAMLGPLLTAYMLWLGREALRDGISDLYFMSREGWVLKEIYDRLHPAGGGGPRSHYLLGSRRALRMAACRDKADVMALLAMPYDPGVTLADLLAGRFGLHLLPDDLDQADQPLDRSFAHRQMLCDVVQRLMPAILAQAAAERAGYTKYLTDMGYFAAQAPGLVDIGWKANIQGALGDLTGRRGTGYYYATLQEAEIWLARGDRHRAYRGQGQSPAQAQSVVLQNRHLMEFLTCHADRSLVHMQDGQPCYRPEPGLHQRRGLIAPLHAGAIAFARLFHDGFAGCLDQIHIAPDLAEAALTAFVTRPAPADARLFLGQGFEDALGGMAHRFLIAPDPRAGASASIWRAGAMAAHATPKGKPAARPTPPAAAASQLSRLERMAVSRFGKAAKLDKYRRDRAAFFEDSKSPLVQFYWRNLAGRMQ